MSSKVHFWFCSWVCSSDYLCGGKKKKWNFIRSYYGSTLLRKPKRLWQVSNMLISLWSSETILYALFMAKESFLHLLYSWKVWNFLSKIDLWHTSFNLTQNCIWYTVKMMFKRNFWKQDSSSDKSQYKWSMKFLHFQPPEQTVSFEQEQKKCR